MKSPLEWAVLDVLRAHLYDYRDKGGKPTDSGWHRCTCGWEGYWCDWQPHVAEYVSASITELRLRDTRETATL